jgi:hypothetical protein
MSSTPWGLPLPNAYAVVTNIQAGCSIDSAGKVVEPKITVFYAVYASEAAYKAGAQPGVNLTVTDTLSGPIMPLIEAMVLADLPRLPGITSVTQTEV